MFQPVEFYNLASWLQATKAGEDQALYRTIVGRAYYAALIAGSKSTRTPTSGPKGHQDVISAVKGKSSLAGNALEALNKARRKADYEDENVTRREVEHSLRHSRVILEYFKILKNGDDAYSKDYLDKGKFITPCPSMALPSTTGKE